MNATARLNDALRRKLSETKAAIDAAYWTFTRCRRGQPVPGHLYTRRNALERMLRRWRGGR